MECQAGRALASSIRLRPHAPKHPPPRFTKQAGNSSLDALQALTTSLPSSGELCYLTLQAQYLNGLQILPTTLDLKSCAS